MNKPQDKIHKRLLKKLLPVPEGFEVDYLTLRFKDRQMEKGFIHEYFQDSIVQVRIVVLISMIFYSIFILLDYILLPELFKQFFILRFGIVIPFAASVIGLSYFKFFKRIFQPVLSFMISVGGMGIVYMIYLARDYPYSPVASSYYVGLILVFIFGYSFLKLRAWWASAAGWSVVLAHEFVLYNYLDHPDKIVILTNFFFVSANIMGSFSSYLYEFNIRKNFYLKFFLAEAKSKVEDLNANLEEKVMDRTRELEIATKKAIESDQLKTRFLANISHEIRTPMNGIIGFSGLIANPDLEPEKRKYFIDIINDRGKYLIKILDNIIDISMIQSNNLRFNPEEFLINPFMQSACSFMESFFVGKKGRLIFTLNKEYDSLAIFTDRTKLEQILTNLANNAAKYASEEDVTIGYELDSDKLRFFIQDKGNGISDEIRPYIFDSFIKDETNKIARQDGTGLGLAISKGLADFLGAELNFTTEPGKGTSFYLDFKKEKVRLIKN